jgi:hypothetical protein
MTDEAERIRPVPFPEGPRGTPARRPPRPTGTLEEILAGIEAATPEERLTDDLTRIERALARVERVLGLPGDRYPR